MNTINQVSLMDQMKEMAAVVNNGPENKINNEKGVFTEIFSNAINSVNDLQKSSANLKTKYELGDPNVNLTQVMIASQKSEISFQALLQVRNKLLMAYQEIMRMQI